MRGHATEVLDLVDRHHDAMAFDRATTLAWTQAQVQLRHLGLDAEDANVFQRIANRMIYADATLRPSPEILERGGGAASVAVAARDFRRPADRSCHHRAGERPRLVRRLLLAHEYWQMKQLSVDLVILNEQPTSYAQEFQSSLLALVGANRLSPRPGTTPGIGAIFVLRADLISAEVRGLLQTAARAVFAAIAAALRSNSPGHQSP